MRAWLRSVPIATLLLFSSTVSGQVSYDKRSAEIMDNYESGDASISFESVKIERGNFGSSECDTTASDLTPVKLRFKYSCRTTVLVRDPDATLHKFSAIACRRGGWPQQSRSNSASATEFMILDYEIRARKASGSSDPQYYTKVRSKTHCVPDSTNPPGSEDTASEDHEPQADATAAPPPADHPNTVAYTIINDDRYDVAIQFYMGDFVDFKGRQAPSNMGWWTLAAHRSYTYVVQCEPGEDVFFSAWREQQEVEWGVGRSGQQHCDNCSTRCGGNGSVSLTGQPDRGPAPALFFVKNSDRNAVSLRFFSQSGGGWDGGRLYSDGSFHRSRLACQAGEKICLGAWRDTNSRYWGVGQGRYGCTSCCIQCGGTLRFELNDAGDEPPPPPARDTTFDYSPTDTPQPLPPTPNSDSGISGSDIGAAASILGGVLGAMPHGGGGGSSIVVPRRATPSAPAYQPYHPSDVSGTR